MTLGRFLRSIEAANRRAARNQERHQRVQTRLAQIHAKTMEKEEAQRQAILEIEQYDETIAHLTGVHREEPTEINWKAVIEEPLIPTPEVDRRGIELAKRDLESYKPGFFDRLFGRDKKKQEQLASDLIGAEERAQRNHAAALAEHATALQEQQGRKELAQAILDGSISAYKEATEFISPLSDLLDAGCEADVTFKDRYTAEVTLRVESNLVIPADVKTLTKTNKVSSRPMAKAKANEVYQDYVCGSALRTAREFFSFLPLRFVVVHVRASLQDPVFGTEKVETVLSIALPREMIQRMNFAAIDASDSMRGFIHRMGFKRSEGFVGIQPLTPDEYPSGAAVVLD